MARMKISVSISEEAAANLRAIAKRSRMNQSRVVDALLLEAERATLKVSVVKTVRRVR